MTCQVYQSKAAFTLYITKLYSFEAFQEINDIKIEYIIKVVMSAIYDNVKDMSRGDKTDYFKTITAEQKNAYDNYMSYQRVLKQRNKDRTNYNDYMKDIKKKARKANPKLYRLQNNKDVANYRARRTLTPNEDSKFITANIKAYIEECKAIKQGNEDIKKTCC